MHYDFPSKEFTSPLVTYFPLNLTTFISAQNTNVYTPIINFPSFLSTEHASIHTSLISQHRIQLSLTTHHLYRLPFQHKARINETSAWRLEVRRPALGRPSSTTPMTPPMRPRIGGEILYAKSILQPSERKGCDVLTRRFRCVEYSIPPNWYTL